MRLVNRDVFLPHALLLAFSCFPLVQLSEHIKDSVLYLDGGCTESFQYLGAFPLLLDLGACTVCSLENMSPLDLVRLADFSFYVVQACARLLICMQYWDLKKHVDAFHGLDLDYLEES